MRGENVSAIDRNRLRRALADIFLMLPFSIFIIIPGIFIIIRLRVSEGHETAFFIGTLRGPSKRINTFIYIFRRGSPDTVLREEISNPDNI